MNETAAEKPGVLILDDQRTQREELAGLMPPSEYEVHQAESPGEARRLLGQEHQGVTYALVDVNLGSGPDHQAAGIKFTKEIRKSYPSVKTIVYSTEEEGKVRRQARKNGAYRFLSRDDLVGNLKKVLDTLEQLRTIETEVQHLRKDAGLLFDAIEHIPSGFNIVDCEGIVWYCNKWNRDLCDCGDDYAGQTCWGLYHDLWHRDDWCPGCPSYKAIHGEHNQERCQSGKRLLHVKSSTEGPRMMAMVAAPLRVRDTGEIIGAIESVRDDTAEWLGKPDVDHITECCEAVAEFGFDAIRVYRSSADGKALLGVATSRENERKKLERFRQALADLPLHAQALDTNEPVFKEGAAAFAPGTASAHLALLPLAKYSNKSREHRALMEIVCAKRQLLPDELEPFEPFWRFIGDTLDEHLDTRKVEQRGDLDAALLALGKTLDRLDKADAIYTAVMEAVREAVDPTSMHFREVEGDVLVKQPVGFGPYFEHADHGRSLDQKDSGAVEAFQDPEGKPVLVHNAPNKDFFKRWAEQHPSEAGLQSYTTFRFGFADARYGTLNVQSKDADFLTENIVDFLQDVARLLGNAIARLRARSEEQERLKKTNDFLVAVLERAYAAPSELYRAVVERFSTLAEAAGCSLFLKETGARGAVSGGADRFVFAATTGLYDPKDGFRELTPKETREASYEPGQGLTGWVALYGVPLRLPGRTPEQLQQAREDLVKAGLVHPLPGEAAVRPIEWADKHSENQAEPQNVSKAPYLAVPIMLHDEVIGVIRVCALQEGAHKAEFSAEDQQILVTCARHTAMAIQAGSGFWRGLGAIIESMDHGVVVVESGTPDMAFVNRSALLLLGLGFDGPWRRVEDLDQNVLRPETDFCCSQALNEVQQMKAGQTSVQRNVVVKDDAAPFGQRSMVATMSPLVSAGGSAAGVVMLLHASPLHNAFRDAMHEIRGPLSTAQNLCDLLGEVEDLPEEATDLVPRILRQFGTFRGRIGNLDYLTKLELGEPLTLKQVDVRQVLQRVVDEEASLDPTKAPHLELPTQGVGRPFASTNAGALEIVLSNLVRNAVEHSPKDAAVHVALEERGNEAIVTVRNTASQQAREEALSVIEQYLVATGPVTSSGVVGRRGVGLRLCTRLCTALGATITVAWGFTDGVALRVALTKLDQITSQPEREGHGA